MWFLWMLGCQSMEGSPDDVPSVLTPDRLEEATLRLTDLGPRMSGTPGEEAASQEVEAMFRDAGLSEVTPEPFVWNPWLTGPATLEIGDDVYPVEALSPSPPVSGYETILSDGVTENEVALFWSSEGGRMEQYMNASFGSAAGMIRVSEEVDFDGSPLIEVGHTLTGSHIPSVAVDRETGLALAARVGEPITLNIASQILEDHTSYNIVAKVEGEVHLPVFVVAHYDSWHPSESAFDNALGVAALAVLAEEVANGQTPAYDVYFIATSGEEQGLIGSQAWVSQNDALVRSGRLVITLDVLWSGEGHFIVMGSSDEIRERALAAAAAEGVAEAVEDDQMPPMSDHAPFVGRGVPALWCGRWSDRHYHTVADTAEYLDFELAAEAMRSQWRVLAEELDL